MSGVLYIVIAKPIIKYISNQINYSTINSTEIIKQKNDYIQRNK